MKEFILSDRMALSEYDSEEMMEDPGQRIGRPRQLYTGYAEREFVPLDKR